MTQPTTPSWGISAFCNVGAHDGCQKADTCACSCHREPVTEPSPAALPSYEFRQANSANQLRRDRCPNRDAHVADEPVGYLAWHEWAKAKAKTHKQRKCSGCDLWLIWEPR